MNHTTYPNIAAAASGGQFFMTLASIVASLLSFYSLLIWIRIVISWVRIGENPLTYYLGRIVDPYLNLFRGVTSLKRERFDLTPLAALALLSIVQSMLRLYGAYGRLTLGMVLALILQTLWSYLGSPLFWFLLILLGVRFYFCYRPSPNAITYIAMLDNLIGGVLNWVQRTFYPGRAINDRKLVGTSFALTLALYIASSIVIRLLVTAASRLGF
jgi:YggT family protein